LSDGTLEPVVGVRLVVERRHLDDADRAVVGDGFDQALVGLQTQDRRYVVAATIRP
jgi:hypothetical protein